MARVTLTSTLAAALIIHAGCGPADGRATLHGEITLDGRPLPDGAIELVPVEGTHGPTSGGVIEQGTFDIQDSGPLPGKYRVIITSHRKSGRMIETEALGELVQVEETEQYIPARYNQQSELTIEIVPGNNQRDFHLKTDP